MVSISQRRLYRGAKEIVSRVEEDSIKGRRGDKIKEGSARLTRRSCGKVSMMMLQVASDQLEIDMVS